MLGHNCSSPAGQPPTRQPLALEQQPSQQGHQVALQQLLEGFLQSMVDAQDRGTVLGHDLHLLGCASLRSARQPLACTRNSAGTQPKQSCLCMPAPNTSASCHSDNLQVALHLLLEGFYNQWLLPKTEEQCWDTISMHLVVPADAQHVSLLLARGTVLGHS